MQRLVYARVRCRRGWSANRGQAKVGLQLQCLFLIQKNASVILGVGKIKTARAKKYRANRQKANEYSSLEAKTCGAVDSSISR